MKETFNPHSKAFKEVSDLPEDKRNSYQAVEGGFVSKDAARKANIAELAAICMNNTELMIEASKAVNISQSNEFNDARKEELITKHTKLKEPFGKAELRDENLLNVNDVLHEEADKINELRNEILFEIKACHDEGFDNNKSRHSSVERLLINNLHLFNNDKALMLECIKANPYNLRLASDNLKNDKDLVRLAVTLNGITILDASDEMKADREIVLLASKNIINVPGENNEFFSDPIIRSNFSNDSEIVLNLIKKSRNIETVLKKVDFDLSREINAAINQYKQSL